MAPRIPCWLAASIVVIYVLTACTPIPAPSLLSDWQYTDLRLLDPADASLPENDLMAVYLRTAEDDLQVRLDLLGSASTVGYDLYLAFDLLPGGSYDLPIRASTQIEWDTLLVVPGRGPITLMSASGRARASAQVLALHDPAGASLLVSLQRQALEDEPAGFSLSRPLRLQAFLTPAGSSGLADQSGVASLDGRPPKQARVLLAFWNTYPAYTPVSALRRWDGAHTGPSGGRHGLYNLLRTAKATGTPLFLLDLNQPLALSALEFAGGLALLEEMQRMGLLVLPANLPDPRFGPSQAAEAALPLLRSWEGQVSEGFGLSSQGFAYLPRRADLPSIHERRVFIPVQPQEMGCRVDGGDAAKRCPALSPQRWRANTLFPLYDFSSGPGAPGQQAGRDGLSVEWKRILLEAALDSSEQEAGGPSYINLGGALPASTWGEPESARATFRWLQENPWIQVLGPHDLSAQGSATKNRPWLSPEGPEAGQTALAGQALELAEALAGVPPNPLGQAALQAYQALFAPVYPAPSELPELRSNYLGQVWSLLRAAEWAESPSRRTTCETDPDRDGEPECILASEQIYAQLEIEDGSLTFLFALDSGRPTTEGRQAIVHQLVGPGSQFISGLSDPAAWRLNGGLQADPAGLPGAFSGPGENFQVEIIEQGLRFTRQGGGYQKLFRLDGQGLSLDVHQAMGGPGEPLRIPLALDPWLRFSPGWVDLYSSLATDSSFEWRAASHAALRLTSTTGLSAHDFRETRLVFGASEDPNRDFPPGHYLPFPLALVEVENRGDFRVSISLLGAP